MEGEKSVNNGRLVASGRVEAEVVMDKDDSDDQYLQGANAFR